MLPAPKDSMHGIPTKSDSSSKKTNRRKTSTNFLEALRELGSEAAETAVADVAGGLAKDAFDQLLGRQKSRTLQPNQELNIAQAKQQAESTYQEQKEQYQRFHQDYLDIRQQEKLLFKRSEQEVKTEIQAILAELKQLALSSKKLAKEVQTAAVQAPVEPGAYHVSFFQKLRETVLLLRQRIDDSATWLETCNKRASKKSGHYWNQFKKSGTKFLLSSERYMATQAG